MLDKLAISLSFVAFGFLTFLGGAYVILDDAFPSSMLRTTYLAGKAWVAKLSESGDPIETDLWREVRRDDRGVTVYDPARAYAGYTLYTSGLE
jgi:hypothetical protein